LQSLEYTSDIDYQLHYAAGTGNLEKVIDLVEYNQININKTTVRGQTPLHYASAAGCDNVVKYLLDCESINVFAKDENKWTPIHYACALGHQKVIELFINSWNSTSVLQNCSLQWNNIIINLSHIVASNGHLNVMKYFFSINLKKEIKNMPLYWSLRQHNLFKYLLNKIDFSRICLLKAIVTSVQLNIMLNVKIIATLTTIDYTQLRHPNGNYLLHTASLKGRLEVVKYLTKDLKIDVNMVGQYNHTPLHCAARNDLLETVKYLVDTLHCDPGGASSCQIFHRRPENRC